MSGPIWICVWDRNRGRLSSLEIFLIRSEFGKIVQANTDGFSLVSKKSEFVLSCFWCCMVFIFIKASF